MTEHEHHLYRTLYQVARLINSSLDTDEVLNAIVAETAQAMRAKACAIRLLSSDGTRLFMSATFGLSDGYLRKGPIEVAKSTIDQHVLEGKPVIIEDAQTDDRFQYPAKIRAEGIGSMLVVPLLARERIIGVMRVYTTESRQFSEEEVEFLTAIANLGGLALENARLYQALKADYESFSNFHYRLFDM
ncbi:MAG: GAF domain-containing protein [Chloroflexi bacterium]|nr:GAF domain-containing protein [Chloroflexota bacterium]MBU1749380.1 GAF domain-containing protein [Chloroflexota bacterium]